MTLDCGPHLIKSNEALGFSHTGEHIKTVLLEMIGKEHFATVGSDSTGNTKLARELTAEIIPTLLIIPDPCHHLSNTIKDISLQVILDMNKGLEKIGKTCFGTLYWASYSLLWCLPAISKLITSGVINTDSSNEDKVKLAWFKHLQAYQNLEMELQQLCTILEPIACTIKCLEGLEDSIWTQLNLLTCEKPNLLQNDNQPTEYGHIFTANLWYDWPGSLGFNAYCAYGHMVLTNEILAGDVPASRGINSHVTASCNQHEWEAMPTKKLLRKSEPLTMNWHSVKKILKESEVKVTITTACEAGLTAVNLIDPNNIVIGTPQPFGATTNKPVSGTNAIGSLVDWSKQAVGSTDHGKKAIIKQNPSPLPPGSLASYYGIAEHAWEDPEGSRELNCDIH
ncbi:hypothetical protein B0H10DRAFT_1956963 [Mycena sp. CBHHK59/15]|nr:hypothetical protein B0H10DRAFT_1956963 [Mycena sp. CBHHK59/15]